MYVRGTDNHEEFNRNEKLVVYFHHEGYIFCWVDLFNEQSDDDYI